MADVAAAGAAPAAGAPAPAAAPQDAGAATGRTPDGKFTKQGQVPAVETPAEPPKPQRIKVKYKDEGKEYEEELGEEEIATSRRQSKWAQRSAQKAAQLERDFQALQAQLKDPRSFWEAAKRLGHDPDKLAEDLVSEKYLPQTMTPEQRQQYELQRQLQARDQELQQYKSKEQQAAEEREAQTFRKALDEQLGEIAKLERVPKTPRALARLADIWEDMHADGYEPTPRELEETVFGTFKADFHALRSGKVGAPLLNLARELMGPDVVTEIQKAALAEWKAKKGGQQQQQQQAPRPVNGTSARPKSETARKPGESFEEHWKRVHG